MAPLATRAVRNQRALSTLFSVQSRGPGLALGLCLSLGQKLTRPSFVPIATFSTDADENLLRVLEAEIVRVDDPNVDWLTYRIPFEIDGNRTTLFMTRKYGDQVIEAVVDNATAPFVDEDDVEGDDDGGDEQDAEVVDVPTMERIKSVPAMERIESVPTVGIGPFEVVEPPSFPMVVTVSKGNDQFLKFGITAFTDGIRIDNLSIKKSDVSDDLACEGPKFEDLDENLRKALQKYLEDRGFDSKVLSFLLDYMEDKKAKKYLLWLNNLKKFVERRNRVQDAEDEDEEDAELVPVPPLTIGGTKYVPTFFVRKDFLKDYPFEYVGYDDGDHEGGDEEDEVVQYINSFEDIDREIIYSMRCPEFVKKWGLYLAYGDVLHVPGVSVFSLELFAIPTCSMFMFRSEKL